MITRGDRVCLEDAGGKHYGEVRSVLELGLVLVKWDSGVWERCLPEELRKVSR